MDCFPLNRQPIPLKATPLQELTSISYTDTAGDPQTVDPATYGFDYGRQQIYLVNGQNWPTAIQQQNAVSILFDAGFGTDSTTVPDELRQMLQLQVGKWFVDPAMESWQAHADEAYERLVRRYMRPTYP